MKTIKVFGMCLVFIYLTHFVVQIKACDTWVACQQATLSGNIIFAKNSDRTVFDSQPLFAYARQKWVKGSVVDLGRIKIPQIDETYAVIGSSPYWCWGFEEGMNEHSVVIGNEGIFTKDLQEEIKKIQAGGELAFGPTGMDIVRLALERSKSAEEAVQVIGEITETYGQFGSGLPTMHIEGAYDNSYMVADPNEAWVVETSGKKWVAKRVSEEVASISNTFSIEDQWDLGSGDIKEQAIRKGWWDKNKLPFNFASAYSNSESLYLAAQQRAKIRAQCSLGLLKEHRPQITVKDMMEIARDRSTTPSLDLDVTASSCVVSLPSDKTQIPVFWWAASVPGVSCYIPYFVHGKQLPDGVSTAGAAGRMISAPRNIEPDRFSEKSFWWRFRRLADKANLDWDRRKNTIRQRFDALENEFMSKSPEVTEKASRLIQYGQAGKAADLLDAFTQECYDKVLNQLDQLEVLFEGEDTGIDPSAFSDYAGIYEIQEGVVFEISCDEQAVFAKLTGQPKFEIFPIFRDRFEFRVTKAFIQFKRDENNQVTGLILIQGAQEIPARKIDNDSMQE